jgi:O-antigen ligase
LLFFPGISETVISYLRLSTSGAREIYWQLGLNIINDNPFLGTGPDTFQQNFYNYAPSALTDQLKLNAAALAKPHPHNFFLYFTAENGIPGFSVSILFFITFFFFAVKTVRLTRQINYDFFVISTIITGIGLALFFRSFIEVTGYLTYGNITGDLPFWIMFMILISIYRKFRNFKKNNPDCKPGYVPVSFS